MVVLETLVILALASANMCFPSLSFVRILLRIHLIYFFE